MRKLYFLLSAAALLGVGQAKAQTPVAMAAQTGLSYTEDFSDIGSWTFGTGGTFASGTGSAPWRGITNTNGTVPNPNINTSTTTIFKTGSSGGVQRGTNVANPTMVLLSTGTADNTTSAAMDFLMDFTGVNAGSLSVDLAEVNNSSGNRVGTLNIYASTDGTNWTELTAANLPFVATNNVASSATVSVALPAAFNNSATAQLRFYYYNGTGGSTGSRPKISIDNVTVTALPVSTPIHLISFSGSGEGASNLLRWNTAHEDAGDYFELQRSADGATYSTIARFDSKGSQSAYSYTDAQPLKGTNYYRLRLGAGDGSVAFSNTVALLARQGQSAMLLWPNPVKNRLNLQWSTAANRTIIVTDMSGRELKRSVVDGSGLSLDMNSLQPGNYLLQCIEGQQTQSMLFVK